MNLPGSRQMTVLKRFFLDLPWQSLTPRLSDPAWAQFIGAEKVPGTVDFAQEPLIPPIRSHVATAPVIERP